VAIPGNVSTRESGIWSCRPDHNVALPPDDGNGVGVARSCSAVAATVTVFSDAPLLDHALAMPVSGGPARPSPTPGEEWTHHRD
jgi:hypothetical protein